LTAKRPIRNKDPSGIASPVGACVAQPLSPSSSKARIKPISEREPTQYLEKLKAQLQDV